MWNNLGRERDSRLRRAYSSGGGWPRCSRPMAHGVVVRARAGHGSQAFPALENAPSRPVGRFAQKNRMAPSDTPFCRALSPTTGVDSVRLSSPTSVSEGVSL
jgi:hypothetical protein